MTRLALFVGALALGVASFGVTTFAHPLNVYVQVAEIDVTRETVTLQLRLTPGVNVADHVLGLIDVDRDGALSAAERTSYAEHVRRDVSLSVDGHAETLRLRSATFASVSELRQGLGDIVLDFDAPVATGTGRHVVAFENRHESSIAAYLVNSLQPSDATIAVLAQERTVDQAQYRLDVEVGAPRATPGSGGGDRMAALRSFFGPGIRHILTGYDHLLFLAALVLAAASLWDLVKVVTAFTVAHSLTLTLAALNLVHIPEQFVEPVIAGSIVFVAVQNVVWPDHARGSGRMLVAFVFGLFHGLGFAGGLLEVMHQMPTGTVLFAILGFSLGVEAGNQIVLIPLFAALQCIRRSEPSVLRTAHAFAPVQRVGSAAISAAGLFYLGVAVLAVL
jgi:hydrogenase/urease accessory protein HupE